MSKNVGKCRKNLKCCLDDVTYCRKNVSICRKNVGNYRKVFSKIGNISYKESMREKTADKSL